MTIEETVRQILKDIYGDGVKIIDFKTQQGSKPGENYSSTISAISIVVETANNNKATLHWVAKCLPPTEFLRKAFNVEVIFRKEIEFYQIVLPEYLKLLNEQHYDIDYEKTFPKFIGAKIADRGDITLIMENVKMDGYRLGKINQGLGIDHSMLVIKKLALFHALGIAMKLKKPLMYETKIKHTGRSFRAHEDVLPRIFNQVLDYLRGFEEVVEFVPRLEIVMKKNFDSTAMSEKSTPREPFSTFVHNDLWINNIMFKNDENSSPVAVKFLDFQRCKIGSPVSDLMLFLYLGMNFDVMKTKFAELLLLYHETLVESLRRLGVSENNFKWENFEEELKHASEDVPLILTMLRFFFKKVDFDANTESFGSLNLDDGDNCRIRHIEMVKDFAERGWL